MNDACNPDTGDFPGVPWIAAGKGPHQKVNGLVFNANTP
jgi:hypothetical protein